MTLLMNGDQTVLSQEKRIIKVLCNSETEQLFAVLKT